VRCSLESEFYTVAMWKVQLGREEEVRAVWSALGDAFARLPHPPKWGTLLQSLADPALFYSFGPRDSQEDVAPMRLDPSEQEAIRKIMASCTEATPGDYREVMTIRL